MRKLFNLALEDEDTDNSYKEPLEVDKLLDLEIDAKDKSDKDITYNDQQFNEDIKAESDTTEDDESVSDETSTDIEDTEDEEQVDDADIQDNGMSAE